MLHQISYDKLTPFQSRGSCVFEKVFIDMSASRRKPDPELPDELVVMDLLTRLPCKQVAQCKCVCKLWKSMIASARFKDVYRSRHLRHRGGGLICYWVEPDTKRYDETGGFLSFNYSPTCRLPEEGFDCLYKLRINSQSVNMTQIVNGLICVEDHKTAGLSLYNVCTGEMMKIPDLLPVDYSYPMAPSVHLGYDPPTRQYKLLRLIPRLGHPTRAEIITLSSSSMWRELNRDASGIPGEYGIDWSCESRVSPADGFLCWHWPVPTRPWTLEGLVLFDISKEKFHKIQLPDGFMEYAFRLKEMCVRAQFMECNKRLAVSVWCISQGCFIGFTKHVTRFTCFVMHDDEGKRWSRHVLEFPKRIHKENAVLVAASWNSCEMVIMSKHGSKACCYGRDRTVTARFRIGKLPTQKLGITYGMKAVGGVAHYWDHSRDRLIARPSLLFDANNLYFPLDDILAGRM